MNIIVLIVIGVILADMLKNWQGTNSLLQSTGQLWKSGVNGMLGQTS